MKRPQQKIIPLEGRRATYGIQRASSTTNAELLSRMLPCSTLTSNEIEERCSIILSEIDRCKKCRSKYIQSNVLHNNIIQTFLPDDLYVELENELNRLLTEQILRDERNCTTPDIMPINNQIIEDLKVDTNLCLACNSQCTFLPCYGVNALSNRKQVLHDELKSCEKQRNTKTIQSVVARSAINGGETTFVRTDLMKELTDEMQMIDSKLYLAKMDKELHDAYASNEPEIVIRSIHNFPMTLKRMDGILALEHEVNRLIAKLVSTEIVEGVLEWMLRGWYFGVIDTPDSSCPSRKKPHISHDQRGSLIDKASSVQLSSDANNALHQARENDSSSEELKEQETTMRYGLFCLTFAYFKALHVVRKEKKVWDGSNDLCSMRHDAPMSEERKKIIEEKKNAEFRRARIESAMAKARAGEEKKRQRLQKERLEKVRLTHLLTNLQLYSR